MNGLGLKGGKSSSGPHSIDSKYTTVTRQQKWRQSTVKSLADLRAEFGGFTSGDGFYWPELMPRRIARAISRVKAKAA